ncbi:MAG: YibE/F family protein [Bacillota bacterium]
MFDKRNIIIIVLMLAIIITAIITPLTVYAAGGDAGGGETEEASDVDYGDENTEVTDEDLDVEAYIEEVEARMEEMDAALEEYESALEEDSDIEKPYSRAKVIKVIAEEDRNIDSSGGYINAPTQIVEVLITKGFHQGETVQAEYALSYNFNDKYKLSQLRAGDEVLLYLEENEDGTIAAAYVAEIARDKYLLYLVIAFVIALVVIGKGKGIKAVVSLVLTAVAVIKILLPAILDGWNPLVVSVAVCAGVIGATMLIISGPNKKTLSAIIGTIGGVIVAGLVAMLVGSLAKMTGIGGDESQMLMYIPQNVHFDFRGLLFAGILIGTMGANMDVGMSIASAMHEVKMNNPLINARSLMKAGMNVGRDVMATMSNTLILAYAGGSLQLMLLLMAYNTPFSHIINWDVIASEVLRAIAGSIGLVFTIPITAFVSAAIERKTGGIEA